MENLLQVPFSSLIQAITQIDAVLALGKSGGASLPVSGESDIDIFVFCSRLPEVPQRQAAVATLVENITKADFGSSTGRFWGLCDFVSFHQAEVCVMYFTIEAMESEIASILKGERLEREDEYFYPTGRLATLLSLHAFHDPMGYLAKWKSLLSEYPPALSAQLVQRHIGQITDAEDFERAVSRRDVLFYHATLERAIDHFLQALFALNRHYFPSRKRTLAHIRSFSFTPTQCGDRLLKAVALGGEADTIPESYSVWTGLCHELAQLIRENAQLS